jgi:hypothetical protein
MKEFTAEGAEERGDKQALLEQTHRWRLETL